MTYFHLLICRIFTFFQLFKDSPWKLLQMTPFEFPTFQKCVMKLRKTLKTVLTLRKIGIAARALILRRKKNLFYNMRSRITITSYHTALFLINPSARPNIRFRFGFGHFQWIRWIFGFSRISFRLDRNRTYIFSINMETFEIIYWKSKVLS